MKYHTQLPSSALRRRMASRLLTLLLGTAWLAAGMPSAQAQDSARPAPQVAPIFAAKGVTASGQPLDLARYRGRVVLVLYWSTDCAVCLDKLPELRANAAGWKGMPFAVVGINLDKRRADWERYEQVSATTLPPDQRIPSIWGPGTEVLSFQPTAEHLPTALLIDKEGRVVRRYEGRIPAQAWDDIADLI
ncbi:TlpA disulfide reductase family protein [Hydrogenophaga sp. 5NK40-0174]|uniref:TlpA family protein disulfide reductase n=1 Tax=Hydrogenophaga sp. 5NK40-0174 TaxID=3127649 RepID=UPI003103EE80